MKLSKILELLLILIIIAFAASKPYHGHHGHHGKQLGRQSTNSNKDPDAYDDDNDDDDDDDFFGLDAEDLDDDDDRIVNSTTSSQDNLDDSDSFLLFGDDFLAVFDDDENEVRPTKKQKINKTQSTIVEIPQAIPTISTQSTPSNSNSNPQLIAIETVQSVVNQLTQKNDATTNNEKPNTGSQLNLQHTSALLQLVQNSNAGINHNLTEGATADDDDDDENIKLENENFLNSTLNDDDEKIVAIDGDSNIAEPLSEIEQEMLLQTLNKIKQQQLQQSIVSTTLAPLIPSKKVSTTAKPSTGFLGIVEDLIEDDDEEEVPEDDDDDDDDDDDEEEKPAEDDDDDDDDDSDEVTKKPSTTTTTSTTVKPSKTKRPTNFIDVIGDTLGL